MSETGQLPTNGQETIPATSKNCGYCVLMDCACIVRASCWLPAAVTRGTKGTGGSQEATPPPPNRASNVHAPEERTTLQIPAASKNSGYCVVMDCARIVRATCLPPTAGTRDTKGTGGSQKSNPPPPPQSEHEGNRGKRCGHEGQSKQKGSSPPPRTEDVPRACIMPTRCMPLRKGQHERPPPHPPRKGMRAARGRKSEAGEVGGGHRGEHRAGESDGRQRVRAKDKHQRPGHDLGPQTDMQSASAGRSGGESGGQAGQGRSPGEQKGAREGGKTWVESGGAGANTAGGGGSGRNGPTGDAGKGPSLMGLGPPPVTVSAPPEHTH